MLRVLGKLKANKQNVVVGKISELKEYNSELSQKINLLEDLLIDKISQK